VIMFRKRKRLGIGKKYKIRKLENIYKATVESIYIPLLRVPTRTSDSYPETIRPFL
jgi:hypothetical protein